MPERAAERAGVRLRVRRVEGAPVVALRVWLPGGARLEALPGQALVTGRMLTEGTRRLDWRALAERAEERGVELGGLAGYDFHGLAADALAEDSEAVVDWMAEILSEATFPEERCRWVCRRTAAELASLEDLPDVRAGWAFLRQLYGDHPLGRPLQGDAETLERLGPGDCRPLHGGGLARGPVVCAAGRIDEQALARHLELCLGSLATGGEAGDRAADWRRPTEFPRAPARAELELADADQAHLFVGQTTVPRAHPDHLALELAGVVLGSGAGLTGRIPTRVREREGLAYSAHATLVAGAGLDPGRLVVYVGTGPERVARAEEAVREELARFVEEGPTEGELAEARSYLSGRDALRRETARQWAGRLAEAELYGVPTDDPGALAGSLETLGRAEVEAAVRRHVDPGALAVTVGLPARR